MKIKKIVFCVSLIANIVFFSRVYAGNGRTAQASQPAISMLTKAESRLSEPSVKTELSKVLTKYQDGYSFFSKNKTSGKDNYFLKTNADNLVKAGMDAVAQLNIPKKNLLPILVEQIVAMQQSFTADFQPAVKQLIESMLNELMAQMNQNQQAQKNKTAKDVVFQVEEYTSADYGEQLQTSNSDISVEIRKLVMQYVWAYTIATNKDIIVAQYAKALVNDLIRAYTASQDDTMLTIPLVTNHINAWQNRYIKSFTAAMDELVRYLKALSK